MTPLLLLEINEVPWRLLDHYKSRFPHIEQFLDHAHQFTTLAVDTGELSPWVTWPTFHRGVNNEQHGIKNLGQDPATFRGKPIWQEIRERGGSIGICGSMQSWPPIEPGEGGFFIPDTFAHDDACFPAYLQHLQAFNLEQVRKNPRVVNGSLPRIGEALKLASSLLKSGIRPRTGMRLACQVLRERINTTLVLRRPVFQTILFWDVFRAHFDARHPPQLSSFFTNHIAGVMHRYWKDVFPGDFPGEPVAESREWLMRFALQLLDDMLADVLAWTSNNPDLVVVLASSMGQAAVHREYHEGIELVVEDLALLMSQTGIKREQYTPLLAMAPQVAVEIPDEAEAARVTGVLEGACCGRNVRFIGVKKIGTSLSITVNTPPLKDLANEIFTINGRSVRWLDAGVRMQEIEAGTAYHVPDGSLAVFCEKEPCKRLRKPRERVNADRVKDWLLAIHDRGCGEIEFLSKA